MKNRESVTKYFKNKIQGKELARIGQKKFGCCGGCGLRSTVSVVFFVNFRDDVHLARPLSTTPPHSLYCGRLSFMREAFLRRIFCSMIVRLWRLLLSYPKVMLALQIGDPKS